jgi:hypothetical protein
MRVNWATVKRLLPCWNITTQSSSAILKMTQTGLVNVHIALHNFSAPTPPQQDRPGFGAMG